MAEPEFSVGQEHGPALVVPVFLIEEAGGSLAFSRCKVEIGCLVSVIVEEDLRVTIDQCTILVVVEVLSPHWIILDVFLLLLQGDLHFVFTFLV